MPATKRKASTTDELPGISKRVRFGGDAPTSAAFPAGPGGPMEIVFSFDTTGSMSSCLVEVRKNLTDMINRLQKDIPGLRMAVFAHGDYCDERTTYVTKYVDFTNDVTKLVDFVNNVQSTGGGDADECYELVLYEVRTKLSWSPGTQRSLVMIGDANPHGPKYTQNTLHLDWRKEVNMLAKDQVHIYGVDCGNSSCEDFYMSLATKTDGKYLQLKDWNNIFDMMMAICYREHGAEFFKAYEHEVRSRGAAVTHEMDAMLKTLRHSDADEGYDTDGSRSAAPTDTSDSYSSSTATPTTIGPALKAKLTSTKRSKVPKPRSLRKVMSPTKLPSVKKPSKTASLKYRERLGKHPFTSLDWSRWQRLMTKKKPTNRTAKNWIPRRFGAVGYRRIGLFRGETRKPAFYEVGVKLPGSQKVNAVYFRLTDGFRKVCHIDSYLFRHVHLHSQIDDVIDSGCDLYVRRANVPANVKIEGNRLAHVDEVRDFVRNKYEYAWNKRVYGKRRHRVVVRRDIRISSDEF
ncbi:uncharacterized protein LOC135485180 [Lineus longissimus]|uniref:uncharacterized protein LOC135485180 n=1 Tax=Lineus longissimus TaxID=88925 RepID=UPI002B4F1CB5